jgi:hypothetical protein
MTSYYANSKPSGPLLEVTSSKMPLAAFGLDFVAFWCDCIIVMHCCGDEEEEIPVRDRLAVDLEAEPIKFKLLSMLGLK